MPHIILASTSRYRRELLARLGLPFVTRAPDAAEDAIDGESPGGDGRPPRPCQGAERRAERRHRHRLRSGRFARRAACCANPALREVAVAQLRACQGRTVLFHTAVAVIATDSRRDAASTSTAPRFSSARLDVAALEQYVRLERPLDCAGSFKAEGLGVALFEQISSQDPTALIGLPLIFVAAALRQLGADPLRP